MDKNNRNIHRALPLQSLGRQKSRHTPVASSQYYEDINYFPVYLLMRNKPAPQTRIPASCLGVMLS